MIINQNVYGINADKSFQQELMEHILIGNKAVCPPGNFCRSNNIESRIMCNCPDAITSMNHECIIKMMSGGTQIIPTMTDIMPVCTSPKKCEKVVLTRCVNFPAGDMSSCKEFGFVSLATAMLLLHALIADSII